MNRLIEWFARNPVAANLLMIIIVAGGLLTLTRIKQEVFPEFATGRITVTVPYLGAAPEEVEQSVCVRIEEAVAGLEGIKRIRSVSSEGLGVVTIEAEVDADIGRLLDDVKNRVDAIDTFPEETEKPIVQELVVRHQVINVAISGDTDERTLKVLGERVRDELTAIDGITQVELVNTRPYEISIEVSETALRRHGLTFDDVAAAVRRSSLDLPGGSIKTLGGEILLRTKGQAYDRRDFERLPLVTRPDGTRLRVGDVAAVVDGFAETDQFARFDGKPSAMVQVFRIGAENALDIADKVKRYVAATRKRFPPGIELTTWQDTSVYLRGRIDLLIRNALQGFVLVFIILALFLKLRLAVWVSAGIPISFLGTLWLMPSFDISINLLSLFAFILVLGIVVDDAIIVGESISLRQERGGDLRRAAVEGARSVGVPVLFAVLTTIAAFAPMLSVSGQTGKFLRVISLIVIPTLSFSLVESLLVLPAHLSHGPIAFLGRLAPVRWFDFIQGFVGRGLRSFIERVYRPTLEVALRWRYATAAIGLTTLMLTVGLVGGGWITFVFFPPVEADNVAAILTMPLGVSPSVTGDAIRRLEKSAFEVRRRIEAGENAGAPDAADAAAEDAAGSTGEATRRRAFRHILSSIGSQPYRTVQSQSAGVIETNFSGAHLGEVHIELVPSEERTISSEEIARRWRELTGTIPDAVELTFTSSIFSPGEAINVQLAGNDVGVLRSAAAELRAHLATIPGVTDITDSFRAGKREILIDILPAGENLGLTRRDVARQVRQAFYGEEAQRVQRGRDDVRVMVRYPAGHRRSLGDLESMRIRTAAGDEVPISAVARLSHGRGYADIQRVDRRRTINVTADLDEARSDASAGEIVARLAADFLPGLAARHEGITYSFEGEARERRESLADLARGMAMALLAIFGLLAVPFRSYIQPLIVLLAVPFGLVGAVWGHMIMGMDLTILSMFGIVALTGVVVNDSLVLVDFINRHRSEGVPLMEAIRDAGAVRFRPILLTSLTTFAGLTPLMLFEKSVQAKFLVPMAVSLGFGVMFSTVITLVLIPVGYAILEDGAALGRAILGGARTPEPAEGSRDAATPPPAP